MTSTQTATALREWARGMYSMEAAVELLIRAVGGRLLNGPWIAEEDGGAWFDAGRVDEAPLSGGERRVLDIAASLVSSERTVSLYDVLPGLDRVNLALVLAAVAHAGGSHEHSSTPGEMLPSLYAWPAGGGRGRAVSRIELAPHTSSPRAMLAAGWSPSKRTTHSHAPPGALTDYLTP